MGVIFDPTRGDLYTAEKGKGAFQTNTELNNKIRIKVSDRKLNKGMLIGSSGIAHDESGEYKKILETLLPHIGAVRIYGVAVLDFPFIAKGSAEFLISNNPKSMDITAGSILVEEAGGKVTTYDNKPWYPEMKSLVGSNGIEHDRLIQLIRK